MKKQAFFAMPIATVIGQSSNSPITVAVGIVK
jgi:hypothetical protein